MQQRYSSKQKLIRHSTILSVIVTESRVRRAVTTSNMAAIKVLNPKAEVARASQSLAINISAAQGLQDVLRSNLGPKGTMKM